MPASTPSSHQPADGLVHQFVVAGLVSASARFVPVPFVDDLIRERCLRFVVSQTLSAHQSEHSIASLKPFYSSDSGCLGGCLGFALRAPLKLLLFPIRKLVVIVTSIHGVPLEVIRTVLIGRTLDRCLASGVLDGNPNTPLHMRRAFSDAFRRMDLRVVRAAIADVLHGIGGWRKDATDSARQTASSSSHEEENLSVSKELEANAEKIREALERPTVASLFAEFDKRFDAALHRS